MKPEEYLIKDYGMIYDATFLKTKDDIVEYFKDDGYDLFDCEQGHYEDEVGVKVMTQDGKYYDVLITAEIGTSKQDRGGRLYFVENIENVSFMEIEKPKPKLKKVYTFNWELTENQANLIQKFYKDMVG